MESRNTGWFKNAWTRLFGQRNEVERQVRRLQNQGANMVRLAHAAATTMILLVSVATTITFGEHTFNAVAASLHSGHPDWVMIIFLGILMTLVVCMDVGALYGSNKIRIAFERHGDKLKLLPHIGVVAFVMVVEGFTYWLMILQYEKPVTDMAIHVAQARAFGAPALAIYLSLAVLSHVTKADMVGIAAMQSGIVAIEKLSDETSRTDASLAKVWAIYDKASSDDIQGLILVLDGNNQKMLPPPQQQIVDVVDNNPGTRQIGFTTGVKPIGPSRQDPIQVAQKPVRPANPRKDPPIASADTSGLSDHVFQRVQTLLRDGVTRSPVRIAREAPCSTKEAMLSIGRLQAGFQAGPGAVQL